MSVMGSMLCWVKTGMRHEKKDSAHAISERGNRSASIRAASGRSAMNPIAQLLSPEDILLDVDASSKKRVFEEVGRLFERRHGLAQAQVVDSLSAREKLGSTGLGHGVAIPHARIKGLPKAVAAIVRTRLPIPFDAPDGKPVSDMVVLLVPEQATEEHLQILAWIAQVFADRQFRQRLRMCVDAASVSRLFADWPQS
jgi:PTS system nitrogen regulatory IIA component